MIKKFLFILLLVPALSLAASVNPNNISKSGAKLDNDIKKSCEKYSNVQANINCINRLQQQKAADIIGNVEYAEKHYKNLSSDALYNKMLQLIKLKKTARTNADFMMNPVNGEVTKEAYEVEINWIAKELRSRHYVPPTERKKSTESYVRVIKQ